MADPWQALISPAPAVCARAAPAMSRWGDPRFHGGDMRCLPNGEMLGLVEIRRAPRLRIGTRLGHQRGASAADLLKGQLDTGLDHEITLAPDFYRTRFPVTVTPFRVYRESSGQAPRDAESLRGAPTEPVGHTTWDEAMPVASG